MFEYNNLYLRDPSAYACTDKNGKVLMNPMVLEQKVSKEDFQNLVLEHQIKNI
jgi:hypothetical protein